MVITINGTITTTTEINSDYTAAVAAVNPAFQNVASAGVQTAVAVSQYMSRKGASSPKSMGAAYRD